MKIRQGFLYIVDFNPRILTKPGKQRPALVVQSDLINQTEYPSTIVIPTTSKVLPQPGFLRLNLPKGICSLDKTSDLLLGQLIAVANISFKRELGALSPELWKEVKKRLAIIFDLHESMSD